MMTQLRGKAVGPVRRRSGAATTYLPSESSSAAIRSTTQPVPRPPSPPPNQSAGDATSYSSQLPSEEPIGPSTSSTTTESTSGSSKLMIHVIGRRFIPSGVCSRRITKIFKSMIHPDGYAWKKVPQDRIQTYFREFKKYFTWDPDVLTEEAVYEIWFHQASVGYSGMLNRFKEKMEIEKPDCVSEDAWRVWNAYWDDPDTVDKADTQRQNRLTEVDGEGTCISRHRGGTLTYIEHLAAMEEELGRPVQPLEFLQRMQFKDGKYVDKRAENIVNRVQEHINATSHINGGSLEGIDMSKAYMETVGVVKGNVYGLGSWGQTLLNSGANISTSSFANQDEFIKNLKEELEQQFRAEMETLKAQMEAQVQSQVRSQVQEVMLALFRFGTVPPTTDGGSS